MTVTMWWAEGNTRQSLKTLPPLGSLESTAPLPVGARAGGGCSTSKSRAGKGGDREKKGPKEPAALCGKGLGEAVSVSVQEWESGRTWLPRLGRSQNKFPTAVNSTQMSLEP